MATSSGDVEMAEPTNPLPSSGPPTSGGTLIARAACTACRNSKTRCDRGDSDTAPCRRCLKTNRECTVAGVVLQVPAGAQPVMGAPQTPLANGQGIFNGVGNARRACDPCRNSKIRCERDKDEASCQRCLKASRACVTSPAGHSGRPSVRNQANPQTLPELNSTNAAMGTNTPLLLPTLASYVGMDILDPSSKQVDGTTKPSEPATQSFQAEFAASIPCIPQLDYLTRVGSLQQAIMADLELVKHCKAADKCPESTLPPELGYNSSFPLGSMLRSSQTLLEILDLFEVDPLAPTPLSNGYGSLNPLASTGKIRCDMPTMFSLFSCYVCLVRIYRTNLSAIHDSMPLLLGLEAPVPQLFPGINIGGFSLEARLDLQVQLLVQVVQDMLGKLEARFGVGEGVAANKSVFEPAKSSMLVAMLDEEASEDPPLHEPRGACQPLKQLLASLKQMTQAENGKRQG